MPASTSETNIRFFRSGGHKHDGVSSSLIDFSKYSIFDFGTDISLNGENNDREIIRTDNQIRFDQYIASFISSQILAPAGIILAPNSVQGQHIGAEEITAINIRANTITANELAINVVQVGDTISSNNYSASTTGWQIRSDGSAEFNNNVTITGNITAGSASSLTNGNVTGGTITGGTITIGNTATANLFKVYADGSLSLGSNTTFANAPFRVTEQGALVATSATITGNITAGTASNISGSVVTGGTISGTSINIGSGAFTVSNAGALVATSATITGNITAGAASTITGAAIRGGTLIVGADVTSANVFKVYSDGSISLGGTTFSGAPFNVNEQGDLKAAAGVVGGWTLSNTTIEGGSTVLYSNGRIDAGNAVIYANGRASFVNGTNYSLTAGGVLDMINGTIAGMTISSTSLAQGSLTLNNQLLVSSGGVGTLISGSTISLKYNNAVVGSIEGFDDTTFGNTIVVDTRQFAMQNISKFAISPTGSANLNIYFNTGIGSGTGTTVVRTTAGRIVQSSSRRVLKENINPIDTASRLVKKLNPVSYTWKAHPLSSDIEKYFKALDTQYGFIVEDVEEVDTGLIHYDYNLPYVEGKEMDYTDPKNFSPSMYDANGILSITVSALKEVLERLEALENR
jgi:carbonic anhydrase/acetyltransferase-like protein (isoleucine patch superfamily)